MRRPLWSLALCAAALLFVWLQVSSPPFPGTRKGPEGLCAPEEGEHVTVTGRLVRLEERQSYGRRVLWIYLDSVSFSAESGEEVVFSEKLICQTDGSIVPRIGSRVQVSGEFSYDSQATNPGAFDAAGYYRILGIGGRLKKAELLAVSKDYSWWQEGLSQLKRYLKDKIYRVLPQKEASVLSTILLGEKSSLDEEIKQLYQRNGIVHILSISGLHITMLGMGFYKIARRFGLPVYIAAVLGGVLLVLYGVMTGMGVSAVRAIGMYLIRMLGVCLGRTYDMLTALGLVGLVMLCGCPEYLNHSGFLLSYGAVCGIGLLLPAFERMTAVFDGENSAGRKLFREAAHRFLHILLPGLSITLFTLPIQLSLFYEVPVYSVFLNLLILPLMNVVMLAGILSLCPFLGFLAWVDYGIFQVYEWLCRLFDLLPGHTLRTGCPESWQIVCYYLTLALVIAGSRRMEKSMEKRGQRLKAFIPVFLLCLAVGSLFGNFRRGMQVTFLDVGQGDGILVQTASGENYLFDCGSTSKTGVGEYVLFPCLKYYGISRLDAVFVSHPDQDHVSGILELLESGQEQGIYVERLILPAIEPAAREESFAELLKASAESPQKEPVRIAYLGRGDSWQSGSTRFTCLHPGQGSQIEEANAYSMCVLAEYGDFSMLLTGDVEGEGEEELCEALRQAGAGSVDVLKAAHHGSRNSTGEKLLQLLSPRLAVISSGRDNSYGHPHQELLERLTDSGAVICRTDVSGAIRLVIEEERWRVIPFLKEAHGEGAAEAG